MTHLSGSIFQNGKIRAKFSQPFDVLQATVMTTKLDRSNFVLLCKLGIAMTEAFVTVVLKW